MIWRVWSVKPYVKFHHLKQLERLKLEPNGSFLASFTRFSIVANGSLKITLTLLSFAIADRYVSLIILATSSAESSVAGKLAFRHKSRIFKNYTMKHSSQYAQYNSLFYLESKLRLFTQTILPSFLTMVG